ncbi:SAM-dependent methyltransferase [uncultured Rubinisphaera sp.]|uniref:SAM-dependent methyltransferase n=1 Tax=uncultured Rubinisphaera sp. TaxID=1678686 RepID=UPI0030D8015D
MSKPQLVPSRKRSVERWESLAREMAQAHKEEPAAPKQRRQGRLTVLGSGIGSLGFQMLDVEAIRSADQVFYCVADPATQVWLKKLRPDAYDLYVFYEDTKPRYHTYVQMSEAMLHYVRQGQHVVGIYYGHPGVFVLSTHRSIAIARREGHIAQMKPGVSALDCLCADLGVDPSYPGMSTFEATDMLVRQRKIDPTLHVVLWQVGVVGEMGYRRRGFINDAFPVLIEYLQETYGPDHEVTHYIASRYPTIPPTIQRYKLSELHRSNVRSQITGISTFYIAPKDSVETNLEMAIRLGLAKPDSKVGSPKKTRAIDQYGVREKEAVEALADFHVPRDYQYQRVTRAAEFVIELSQNLKLQALYAFAPKVAVSTQYFPGLTPREIALLASRRDGHLQIACKGMTVTPSGNEQFVIAVLSKPSLAKSFFAVLKSNYNSSEGLNTVDQWISSQGYQATIENFSSAATSVSQSMLLPWSGVYTNSDESLVLTVIGDPVSITNSVVYANLSRIKKFSFSNGTLSWNASDGNPNNGIITFTMPPSTSSDFTRSLSGKYWAATDNEPSSNNLTASEADLGSGSPMQVWTGQYATQVTGDGKTWLQGPEITVCIPEPGSASSDPFLTVGSTTVNTGTYANNTYTWGTGNSLEFAVDPKTPTNKTISGTLSEYWSGGTNTTGATTPSYDQPYRGQYMGQALQSGTWSSSITLYWDGNVLTIGQTVIPGAIFSNGVLSWSTGSAGYTNGSLTFQIDASTNQPTFQGVTWEAGTQPTSPNLRGAFASLMLQSYSGNYPTTLGNAAGPALYIQGEPPPAVSAVFCGGNQISPTPPFINDRMQATVDSTTSFDITFSYDSTAQTRKFIGSLTQSGTPQNWSSAAATNDIRLWTGTYQTSVKQSDGTFAPDPVELEISSSTDGSSMTIKLSSGDSTVTIVNPAYNSSYSTLSWPDNSGTPENNAYSNAAIAFSTDAATNTKFFQGNFWGQGDSPPASGTNWKGQIPPTPPPVTPTGGGDKVAVIAVLAAIGGIGVLGTMGYLISRCVQARSLARMGYRTVELNENCMKCKQD